LSRQRKFSTVLNDLENAVLDTQSCLIGENVKYPGGLIGSREWTRWKRLEDRAFVLVGRLRDLSEQARELAIRDRERKQE